VAAVPLATDIRAVINTAKQEVEAAAKAYYAAKVSSAHRCVQTKDAALCLLKSVVTFQPRSVRCCM
jgi:hypothetical protein